MTGRRAAAYVRVSSSDEPTADWSLTFQEHQIREYAEHNGYEVVQPYRDEIASGTDKCPGLEHMLFHSQTGLFSSILVLHASRLFHNTALARRYADELRGKLGIEIVFVYPPTIDPTGLPIQTLNELFDEYARCELRLRTTLGKQARAQRGLFNGTLPFGYTLDHDGVPVPHPSDSVGLLMAFNAYSTGRYRDAQIAELLNQHGYHTTGNWGTRPFTKDTVNRILQNSFYLGRVKYKKVSFPGLHSALIEQERFDQCQEVRAQRARSRSVEGQRRVYLLAGVARCSACGLTLRCSSTQSQGGWRYYRHTAHERGYERSMPDKMVRADLLEQQWADLLSSVQLPDGWRQRIQGLVADAGPLGGEDLGPLWTAATLEERRALTQALLQAVYIDVQQGKIVTIEPQPDAQALFAGSDQDLGVTVR